MQGRVWGATHPQKEKSGDPSHWFMEARVKKVILVILVLLMLTLSACASSSPTTEGSDSAPAATQVAGPTDQGLSATAPAAVATQDASGTAALNTSYENSLPDTFWARHSEERAPFASDEESR